MVKNTSGGSVVKHLNGYEISHKLPSKSKNVLSEISVVLKGGA